MRRVSQLVMAGRGTGRGLAWIVRLVSDTLKDEVCMSGYTDGIKTIVKRTYENLDTICRLEKSSNGRYGHPATQLLNSLLGILVFTVENNDIELPRNVHLNSIRISSRPDMNLTYHNDSIHSVSLNIRHSVAHYGINDICDDDGNIYGFRFINKNNNTEVFKIELTCSEIRILVDYLVKWVDEH